MARTNYNELFQLAEQIRGNQKGVAGIVADTTNIITSVADAKIRADAPLKKFQMQTQQKNIDRKNRRFDLEEQRDYLEGKELKREARSREEKLDDRTYREGQQQKRDNLAEEKRMEDRTYASKIKLENQAFDASKNTYKAISSIASSPDSGVDDVINAIDLLKKSPTDINGIENSALVQIKGNQMLELLNKKEYFDSRDGARLNLNKTIDGLNALSDKAMQDGLVNFANVKYDGTVAEKVTELGNKLLDAQEMTYIDKNNRIVNEANEVILKHDVLRALKDIDASTELINGIDRLDVPADFDQMPIGTDKDGKPISVMTSEGEAIGNVSDAYLTALKYFKQGRYEEANTMVLSGDQARQQSMRSKAYLEKQKGTAMATALAKKRKEKQDGLLTMIKESVAAINQIENYVGASGKKVILDPIGLAPSSLKTRDFKVLREGISVSVLNELRSSKNPVWFDSDMQNLAKKWTDKGGNRDDAVKILNAIKRRDPKFEFNGIDYNLSVKNKMWGEAGGKPMGKIDSFLGYEGNKETGNRKAQYTTSLLSLFDKLNDPIVRNMESEFLMPTELEESLNLLNVKEKVDAGGNPSKLDRLNSFGIEK